MIGREVQGRSRPPRPARPRRAVAPGHLLVLVIGSLFLPAMARAEAMDANMWVTDGDVGAIVPWGNTIYIGGSFGYVGPNTGGWTDVDPSGFATTRLPRIDGPVTAMISDGAGGWFIAGPFTQVAGIARPGLARVLADGSVATWTPNPAPVVDVACLEHSGTRLFVATNDGDLVAYDDATGNSIAGWAPAVTGQVSSLAVNGTTLYVAGDLSFNVTGSSQVGTGIAAVNTSTGAIAAWDPAPDAPVTRIRAEGRWLYATGTFTSIGGQTHASLARALLSTRVFDGGWNPSIDAPAAAMTTASSGFWIGGEFFLVNSDFRDRIAVLDTTTGATLTLAPSLAGVDGNVTAMALQGTTMYLGISPLLATPLGGQARPLALRCVAASGVFDKFWRILGEGSPTHDGDGVTQLGFTGTGTVVAGAFVSAGGRSQVAIAALDRATGIPRPWDPRLSIDETFPIVPLVSSIVPTNHAIYIGGYFTHVGAQARKSLAAIDSVTATAKSWKADLGPVATQDAGAASALALFQDKLVVGGQFNSISGVAHSGLAQVDTVVGTPVAGWSCDASSVSCLLVRSTTVFFGGTFTTVGGQGRNHVAAVNGSTGALLAWNPNVAGNAVFALANRGDSLYVAGDYSQVASQTRVCLAGVSATSGALLGWAPSAFGPVRALAIDGPALIVGGEFSLISGQPQEFLARLDRFTGALVSGLPAPDGNVLAVAIDGGSVYAGGSFGQIAQSPTAFLGRIGGPDVAGPAVAVVAANGGEYLVIGSTYRFEYSASDPSGVASVDVELSRTGSGGPWTMLAAGIRNTSAYLWQVTGPAVASNAWLRVTARDFGGNLANDKSNAAFSIGAAIASVDRPSDGSGVISFALGPNPARLQTHVRFTLRQPLRMKLQLIDVQGREVWRQPETSFAAGDNTVACELSSLEPGLYFMRMEHARGSRSARLIVFR